MILHMLKQPHFLLDKLNFLNKNKVFSPPL
jgi:hypothetical protein